MAAVGYNRMGAAALLEEDIRCIVEVDWDIVSSRISLLFTAGKQ